MTNQITNFNNIVVNSQRQINSQFSLQQNHVKEKQNKLQTYNDARIQKIINKYCEYYEVEYKDITPTYQNQEDGNTIAMWLAKHKQVIPKCWYHDPSIQNYYDWTVALIYANKGIIPPKEWYHDKFLRCKYLSNSYIFYSVQNLLQMHNVKVPEEWQYTTLNKNEDTQAMIQARNGQIPEKQYYHNPKMQNIFGYTVAMILANQGIIPPKEWEHDKFIINCRNTVAEILSSRGIIPPPQWMITKDEDEQFFNQICYNLRKYCYLYADGQFILNAKTLVENDTCQICLNGGEQEFIQTKCGHKVCLQCFRQIIEQNQQNSCPNCRQKDWYLKIQEDE